MGTSPPVFQALSSRTHTHTLSLELFPLATMETIKNTVNAATEKASELTSGASKEANKEVAKDSNASLSTRATAAKDALGDKVSEEKHATKGEAHQEAAKH